MTIEFHTSFSDDEKKELSDALKLKGSDLDDICDQMINYSRSHLKNTKDLRERLNQISTSAHKLRNQISLLVKENQSAANHIQQRISSIAQIIDSTKIDLRLMVAPTTIKMATEAVEKSLCSDWEYTFKCMNLLWNENRNKLPPSRENYLGGLDRSKTPPPIFRTISTTSPFIVAVSIWTGVSRETTLKTFKRHFTINEVHSQDLTSILTQLIEEDNIGDTQQD